MNAVDLVAPSQGGLAGLAWPHRLVVIEAIVIAAAVYLWVPLSYVLFGRLRVEAAARSLGKHPGQAFLVGLACDLLLLILFYVGFYASGMTSWILIAVLSVVLWGGLIFGYAVVALWTTEIAFPGRESLWWAMLGGGLVTVLQAIPLIGGFFFFFFATLAIGSAATTAYRTIAHAYAGEL